MACAISDSDVLVMKAVRLIFGMGKNNMVAKQKRLGHEGWPYDCLKMETHAGLSCGGVVWDTPMAKWAGEGKDWVQEIKKESAKEECECGPFGR